MRRIEPGFRGAHIPRRHHLASLIRRHAQCFSAGCRWEAKACAKLGEAGEGAPWLRVWGHKLGTGRHRHRPALADDLHNGATTPCGSALGITACLLLTVSLITLIFYFHPSTRNVTSIFRTVTILPETGGRVAEVYVNLNDRVEAGAPLFRLDSSEQEAALETDRRRISEIEAETAVAQTELAAADGLIDQARGAYQQALDELTTRTELRRRDPNAVAPREIERLQVVADGRKGAVDAAMANKQTLEMRITSLLPAQKASAEAALAQAQVELDKTLVVAGFSGTLQQFARVKEIQAENALAARISVASVTKMYVAIYDKAMANGDLGPATAAATG